MELWERLRANTYKVGNEFSQVEGLWSQFENVMAKEPEAPKEDTKEGAQNDRS